VEVQPLAIDLFAGAGGFGLGFALAGFSVPFSLEVDAWACDTLQHNHPQMRVVRGDIRDYSTRESISAICPQRPDVLIGGPPCQGFSIAGSAQKDPDDPRNTLFMHFAAWVGLLEPTAFVMENVKGMLARRTAAGEKVIEIITRTLAAHGYTMEVWMLNAAEYGVPQVRERVFIVGHRQQQPIGKPPATHTLETSVRADLQRDLFDEQPPLPALTLWEAISDLPALAAGEGEEAQPYTLAPQSEYQRWARGAQETLYNHAAMEHSARVVERFKHIGWGESSSDVPQEHGARRRNGNGALSLKSYDQNNRRLHPGRPSHTIAASFYANFVHPFQHRNLTAREGARIQSFPDSYRFLGKKTVVSHKLLGREERFDEQYLCQYNQVGNAVPPLLARAIALHLKETLHLCHQPREAHPKATS
jgi:DNA (cytosine-5)-methyltransferase 1